ncbi:MAG: hypothetical protein UT32_C0018G0051 [Parcubacteria group bacterium GW2011_GWC2_39_14]|nr:MAG: hypothetical protein UT32_C0018G0051 [Parcubacteria group bacterium GW2011_GWC2_39_14]KKR54758.1 MAG: hypothetical protein UT91_C0010G0051 [Parcubacteria group bacterium GW2011_GWA2_40_23]
MRCRLSDMGEANTASAGSGTAYTLLYDVTIYFLFRPKGGI